jgi:hypothetical protein
MTEAAFLTPTRTHAPCAACYAAYRREALALLTRLIEHAPARRALDDEIAQRMAHTLASYPAGVVEGQTIVAWTPSLQREAVREINNDPEPYQYAVAFRTTLYDDGVDESDIPAAQHCAACEALE